MSKGSVPKLYKVGKGIQQYSVDRIGEPLDTVTTKINVYNFPHPPK
jgi:hypothetical protein